MSPIRSPALVLGVLVAFEVTALSPVARATKSACARAYEQAQVQRKDGKLREARKTLITCAQASCPGFIRSACSRWTSEVDAVIPTVVFSAKDAKGNDLTDVTVDFDGKKLTDKLTGLAIAVDPGQHTLRFEHTGDDPVEQSILITEGEKARVVKVTFGHASVSGVKPPPPAGDHGGTKVSKGKRTVAYVLGGVGVLGLASFAYFGLKGKSDESTVRNSGCAPNCSSAQVDPIKTKYLIADISLGVGVVSLGLATYFFLTSSKKTHPQAEGARRLHFDVVGSSKGTLATLSGRF